MSAKTAPTDELLLETIDQAWSGENWIDMTLTRALHGVTAEAAAWRPSPGRHSIHELVLHLAFWKHTLTGRMGGETDPFPYEGRDWFARDGSGGEREWKADRALLKATHERLRSELERLGGAGKNRYWGIGTGQHDVYHAAQIMLLKRMHAELHPAPTRD